MARTNYDITNNTTKDLLIKISSNGFSVTGQIDFEIVKILDYEQNKKKTVNCYSRNKKCQLQEKCGAHRQGIQHHHKKSTIQGQ